MTALLAVDGLCRRYGSLAAVDGVDLRIAAGERYALIGPNGAGKTTLLDLISGATRPSGGRISFAGSDVTRLGPARRARLGIGRTHQRPAVWASLTALDNVAVAAWRHAGGYRRAEARYWLDRLDLAKEGTVPAGRLSHEQRRQLEIAMALAGRPRLLLLDEPAAGLSGIELDRLGAVLADLPRTVAVLLVEHRLDLVRALADTVTALRDGRVDASGDPDTVLVEAGAVS